MKSQYDIFTNSSDTKSAMDTYNTPPNGIDYDPDLLYGGEAMLRPQQRQRAAVRRDSRDDDMQPAAQPRTRRRRDTADSTATREEIQRRDRQRRQRETNERLEEARRIEAAEKARRDELMAEREAERQIRRSERAADKARRQAERAAQRKERKPLSETAFVRFFMHRRTHAFFGTVLIAVAVYILIAAISFLRAGTPDQSAVAAHSVDQLASGATPVENRSGVIGAVVAQYIFAQGLGLGSFVSIIYLVMLGLGLMGVRKINFWSATFKALLVAIVISVVGGFFALWTDSEFLIGGVHGRYVNEFLIRHIQWVGAALVSLVLISAVIFLYLNDFIEIYRRYRDMKKARHERAEQIRMEREEEQARVVAAMKNSSLEGDAEDEQKPVHQTESVTPVALGFDDSIPETDEYAITPGEQPATPAATLTAETPAEIPPAEPAIETPATEAKTASVAEYVEPTTDKTTEAPAEKATVSSAEKATVTPAEAELTVVANKIEAVEHVGPETLFDPTAELSHYTRPGLDLLNILPQKESVVDIRELENKKTSIIEALAKFNITIDKLEATVGPTVTLYEFVPGDGVKIASIKQRNVDLALKLKAIGIRIIAPMPGKGTVGIEVPNRDPQTVSIHSVLSSKAFQECDYELPMAMGATISNKIYIADLTKMPHLLIAGATGQGKSVGLNTIIASLIYKKHPAELKFVLIDPKMVEFSNYACLENHFLAQLPDEEEAVVTNPENALRTLNSLCVEMDQRYDLLKSAGEVKVTNYNKLFINKKLNPEKGHRYLPYIVVIIDEFADLIMTQGKAIETPIARIAQKARAVGIHMIIATQRPSTNVITGLIKANFPGRIAFRVTQMVDSRTILDCNGANELIGRGDMIFSRDGIMDRVQCAFIDTPEVKRMCAFISNQPGFEHPYFLPIPDQTDNDASQGARSGSLTDRDPLFNEAAEIVVSTGKASTSWIQRRLSVGYVRAGKIMDQLECAGIVGPGKGSAPRDILVDSLQLGSIINERD